MFEDQILEMILSGELSPGTRLPSESELAKYTGISKSAVNMGMKSLEKKGFLKITPRQKIEVADYYETGNLDTLVTILRSQGNELDIKIIKSILIFREAIESKSIQLLAENHTDEDIAVLDRIADDILKRMVEGDSTIEEYAEMLFRYHRKVAVLSGDIVLPMSYNAFHDVSIPLWVEWIKLCGMARAVNVLKKFTRLIDDGDTDGAMEAYRRGEELFRQGMEMENEKSE